MSEFLSLLIGESFDFATPFMFYTKTEILKSAQAILPSMSILHTCSCMQFRYQQCGYCPGCILRRLAFALVNIQDNVDDYKFNIFSGLPRPGLRTDQAILEQPIREMDYGMERLKAALGAENPFDALMDLSGVKPTERRQLIEATSQISGSTIYEVEQQLFILYRRYAEEWNRIRSQISFLPSV